MKNILQNVGLISLFILIIFLWMWVLTNELPYLLNISVIVGGIILIFPIAWLGRTLLDKNPTKERAVWITTIVHYSVLILSGISIIRAIITHNEWMGWTLPIPTEIGLFLVIITAGMSLLAVINLAVKGFGAPFAIALSHKLAVDWMYAWTRNPMVLATLALGISMGLWFQSALFLLWILISSRTGIAGDCKSL